MVRVERLENAGAELRDSASRRVDPRAAVRRVRRVRRRVGDRRRAVHARAGHAVQLVARAHARRTHESLGPDLAALRSGRFPAQVARRARRRLADQLRRRQAVLRQRRSLHRAVRIERRAPQRAGRHLHAAAQAAVSRAVGEEGVGQAEHHLHSGAAVDHHPAAERAAWPVTTAASAIAAAR